MEVLVEKETKFRREQQIVILEYLSLYKLHMLV